MERSDGPHRRRKLERVEPSTSGHLPQGRSTRSPRHEERVRVSGLQNEATRTDVRVDVQPEDEREVSQVDSGRSCHHLTNITLILYTAYMRLYSLQAVAV